MGAVPRDLGRAMSLSTSDAGQWGHGPAANALAHFGLCVAFVLVWWAVTGDAWAGLVGYLAGYLLKEIIGDMRRARFRLPVVIDSAFDFAVSGLGGSALLSFAAGDAFWTAAQALAAVGCAGFIYARGSYGRQL